ncbi:hypothetical protein PYW07_008378 [Mythimna separata]|uniref:Retrotransposon gag domain-containing protein n=1 Tax=Mythimna separata TaxID=271217 RepID=A0AAD8DN37_MYTSE|nr:hypothetical protein PYW07_008378 [Mythimna separata]
MNRQPAPEFVPYNMMNNNNYNNNNGNQQPRPQRHPAPPPGMGDVPLNHPHPGHPIPIFSVNGAGIYPTQFRPEGHPNGRMFVMMIPEPPAPTGPADFGQSFPPHQPSEMMPPNDDENYYEDGEAYGPPVVNFALCKERFNGVGDVRPFINAVIDFKYCAEMKDETALRSFALLLTDQAAHWWQANKTFINDWDSALKLLRSSFRPRTQPHRIYRRFFSAPQTEESTAAFVQRTKGLLSKIPANTLTQETQLDLIFAMLDRRIKDNVNRDDCDTVLDLMERARKVEEAFASPATAPPQEPAAPNAAVEKQVPEEVPSEATPLDLEAQPQESESLQSPVSPQEGAALDTAAPSASELPVPSDAAASAELAAKKSDTQGTPSPTSPSIATMPASDLGGESCEPCDHCRIYGMLFERACRKLHKGEKTPQNMALLEELSKLDAEKFGKLVCFRCRSSGPDKVAEMKCTKCTHEVTGGCPLMTATVYDVDFNFVVDTGSSHSIASPELVNHLVACGQEFAFNVLIMPIRGIPVRHVFRVANVEVMVAGVPVPATLVDLPGATKNVFGMDFIKQAGLVLDFSGKGTWTVRGGNGEQTVLYERLNRMETPY